LRAALSKGLALFARNERLIFGLLIVIQLIPIWEFKYLPTTDGAAHVASADVMRKIGDPSLTVFRQYYFVSGEPSPNLIGHLALAGLLSFLPPLVAEKVLVSLYIALFPLAVRYAVRSIRARATPLAFLAFPMVYSYVFAQGFYNFCLSIAVFFFVVGYWIRHRDRLTIWRGVVLAGISLLLYACHLFSLMMACGVIGLLSVWFSGRQWKSEMRPAIMRVVVTLLAVLPVLVLALIFKPSAGKFVGPAEKWSPKDDLVDLLQFHSLVSYRNSEAWLGGAVASLFVALTLMVLIGKCRRRTWSKWDVLLLLPLGLVGVYFKAHDAASSHFYIPQRVMLYIFLTLLLWLAGQAIASRVRWATVPLAIILALGFVASHAMKYREFAPQLREFVLAGDNIKANTTFLPLIFAPRGCNAQGKESSVDVSPFYMASGYIAVARQAVDLRNYEADTDHFPVRFVPKLNPYEHLAVGGFDTLRPNIDIDGFRRLGGEVDYVLLWGVTDDVKKDVETVALYEQLAKGYERVELGGAKWTELWKRRGL